MKLTTKSKIAIHSLVYLAKHQKICTIKEISKNLQCSEKFVEHIFGELKMNHLVYAIRGIHGGYGLAIPANQISVFDCIGVFENYHSISKNDINDKIMIHLLRTEVFYPIDRVIKQTLSNVSIADLIDD